jgi:hypothetical protein
MAISRYWRKPPNGFELSSNRPNDNQNRNQMVPVLIHLFDVLFGAASELSLQGLLALQEEAVRYIVRIKVGTDDCPRRVEAFGESAL